MFEDPLGSSPDTGVAVGDCQEDAQSRRVPAVADSRTLGTEDALLVVIGHAVFDATSLGVTKGPKRFSQRFVQLSGFRGDCSKSRQVSCT